MNKVAKIEFSPCDWYGAPTGIYATLRDEAGNEIGSGVDTDEQSAVVEALVSAGLSFDDAFNGAYSLMAEAAIVRN